MTPRGYLALAGGVAILLFVSLAFRWNSLRAQHLETINNTASVLTDAGWKNVNERTLQGAVASVLNQRDKARSERDKAVVVIDLQTAGIETMERDAKAARDEAARQKVLIAQTTRERDAWIAKARNASTRTERLSAEQEVAECEGVLNDLYRDGF